MSTLCQVEKKIPAPMSERQFEAPAELATATKAQSGLGRVLRLVFSFPVALGAILVSTVFGMARNGLADPDIWFHLHHAEYLITQHKVPRVEMYSFTAIGQPWINPEYLAEVPYYLAWRAFGLGGIKALSLVLLESIFLGLLYLCWRRSGNVKASAIACCFAVFLAAVSFGPRTILFGYGYLVVLLIILERFREPSSSRSFGSGSTGTQP